MSDDEAMLLLDVWDWMNRNGSGLQAAGTMITAVIAVWALRSAALDSRERSRPVVVAQFRIAKDSHSAIDFVVSNAGQSPARDVMVTFDPPLTIPEGSDGRLTKYLIQRYASAIPTLAPDQELSNIWFSGSISSDGPDLENAEPTPDAVTVTVRYRGSARRHVYIDTFPLHLDSVRLTTYSTSTDSFMGRMKAIQKSVQSVSEASTRIAKAADYFRREEIEAEASRVRARVDEFRAHEAQRRGPDAREPYSALRQVLVRK